MLLSGYRSSGMYKVKFILFCITIIFLIGCFIAISSLPSEECNCKRDIPGSKSKFNPKHKLGVIVPFRERFEELLEFAPHIHDFISKQGINHKIYIINQVDQYRFNRASLINIGFLVAVAEGCDYIAMHDVDLLPLNPSLSYNYPSVGLFHIASPELHPRYHYPTFVGGILLVKKEDFEAVNGMSNKYWGWGLEDDEFYVRLKEAAINVSRPVNITTGIENTFRHMHDRVVRKRDMTKCFNQREVTRRRDRQTGLRDVSYSIQARRTLMIDNAAVTVVNVALRCNRTVTPWCLCSEEKKSSTANLAKVKTVKKEPAR
ncbi:beta-1,4-galactosyltransferase 7-like isoform X1 [Macrosteles quadrilineatus]|uniref:beta-1,4-galactosyltransferase 7-like isoform X1 n=1 Tax=Macrosteles quadrilineatus TaxID=74068 RepID=UPI0023E0F6D9|nr:beta-1,4-galactosyltransferase 7-like isoform X1 [Macrosteles quadrilineatus]